MGKRGPRPLPTAMKELRGTIKGSDRRRGPDALAPGNLSRPPAGFTPAQKRRWRQILADAPRNVLHRIDAAALVDFIVNETIAAETIALVNGEYTILTERGRVRNPALLVYFKAIEAKRAIMRELGFTPSSRVGLPIDDSTDDDSEESWRWLKLERMREKSRINQAEISRRMKEEAEADIAADAELLQTPPEDEA
jgi:P27 family predicted phage terminase small subunit